MRIKELTLIQLLKKANYIQSKDPNSRWLKYIDYWIRRKAVGSSHTKSFVLR